MQKILIMKKYICLVFLITISMVKADEDDYSMPSELYEELETYYESDYKMAKGDEDPDESRYCKYDDDFDYDDKNKRNKGSKKIAIFKKFVPMSPCKCKSLWCFIKSVKNLIKKLYKYYLVLAGLPCYLKKQILNKILLFYLRGCPKYLRALVKKWVNYYINKWC